MTEIYQTMGRKGRAGTKDGERVSKEEEKCEEERVSSTAESPSVSDSPMDDLWWALPSFVIGRHIGFQCEIFQDLCALGPNKEGKITWESWDAEGKEGLN